MASLFDKFKQGVLGLKDKAYGTATSVAKNIFGSIPKQPAPTFKSDLDAGFSRGSTTMALPKLATPPKKSTAKSMVFEVGAGTKPVVAPKPGPRRAAVQPTPAQQVIKQQIQKQREFEEAILPQEKLGRFGASIVGQGVFGAPVRVGLTTTLMPLAERFGIRKPSIPYVPSSEVEKFLFGEDEIYSIPEVVRRAREQAEAAKSPGEAVGALGGGALVLGGTILDALPGGGAVKKVGREGAEILAKQGRKYIPEALEQSRRLLPEGAESARRLFGKADDVVEDLISPARRAIDDRLGTAGRVVDEVPTGSVRRTLELPPTRAVDEAVPVISRSARQVDEIAPSVPRGAGAVDNVVDDLIAPARRLLDDVVPSAGTADAAATRASADTPSIFPELEAPAISPRISAQAPETVAVPRPTASEAPLLTPAQAAEQVILPPSSVKPEALPLNIQSVSGATKEVATEAKPTADIFERAIGPQRSAEVTERIMREAEGLPADLTKRGASRSNTSFKLALPPTEQKATKIAVEEVKPITNDAAAKAYIRELVSRQDKARKGVPPWAEGSKLRKLWAEFKQKIIDEAAPIEDAISSAQKKAGIGSIPTFDITNQIDRVYRAPVLAGQFMRDNGLDQVIRTVDDLDAFEQYLIAKQALRVEERGIKTGRDLVRDRELVNFLAPRYETDAQKVTAYSRALLDYSVESGLVSKDLADELKQLYPDYVPLQRIFSEVEKVAPPTGRGGGLASQGSQNIVKRLKGSDREIESPIQALLAKTNDAFVQGERNKAGKILASYEGVGDIPVRELKTGESAAYTFSFMDNGVKRTFETTPEIAKAAQNLSPQQMNVLMKVLAAPVRLLKLGATGFNVPFILANLAKDQIFVQMTKTHPGINPVNFVQALTSVLKKDDLYSAMVRAGGGGTSFDITRAAIPSTVASIRSRATKTGRAKYLAKNPGELLRAIEDIFGKTEELTRMQQFIGARNHAIKQGHSLENATVIAAMAARENSTNFVRHGEWGKVISWAIPYFNAGIQGSRTYLRAAQRNPARAATATTVGMFMPMAALTAWNLSDPKRREAYEDIAPYEKDGNLILVPPNPVKGADGGWNVIKIPLPSGVNKLAIPVRVAIEQMHGIDQLGFDDFAQALIGPISPLDIDVREENMAQQLASALTPQAIKPIAESAFNKNFFTGRDIVPYNMKDLPPEMQKRDTTSATAQQIGKILGVSPLKVENFVRTTAAGLGSTGLHYADLMLVKAGVAPEKQISGEGLAKQVSRRFVIARGGESENKFWTKYKAAQTEAATEKAKTKEAAEMEKMRIDAIYRDEGGKAANAALATLQKENPAVFEAIGKIQEEERLGLTSEERAMKNLGVANGARAKFIFEMLESSGMTGKEKNAYLNELKAKKVISKTVEEQLGELIRGQ